MENSKSLIAACPTKFSIAFLSMKNYNRRVAFYWSLACKNSRRVERGRCGNIFTSNIFLCKISTSSSLVCIYYYMILCISEQDSAANTVKLNMVMWGFPFAKVSFTQKPLKGFSEQTNRSFQCPFHCLQNSKVAI